MTGNAQSAPSLGPAGAVREFFTLERAMETEKKLGESRPEVTRAALLSRQKAESAETLWANGHTAEGSGSRATRSSRPSPQPKRMRVGSGSRP